MRRTRQIGLLIVLTAFLSACVGGWVTEDSPTNEDLYAVWGATGTDVFAVGANGTFLMRQNAKWRKLDSGTEKDLLGVWGTGQEHVVAVGSDCAVYEYNGQPEPPPEGEEPPPDLRELSAATCLDFTGIDGVSGNQALVVGQRTLDRNMQRYDGNGLVNSPMCGDRMLGVSQVAQETAFAVGDQGSLCTFDGSWHEHTIELCPVSLQDGACPTESMLPVLWAVWVADNGQGAIAGSYGGLWPYPPPETWPDDPHSWQPIETNIATDLRAVHGWVNPDAEKNPTTIYAVGSIGVMLRIKGEKVIREAPGSKEDLHGVWVSEDGNEIYAVGSSGTILHYSK